MDYNNISYKHCFFINISNLLLHIPWAQDHVQVFVLAHPHCAFLLPPDHGSTDLSVGEVTAKLPPAPLVDLADNAAVEPGLGSEELAVVVFDIVRPVLAPVIAVALHLAVPETSLGLATLKGAAALGRSSPAHGVVEGAIGADHVALDVV